jgi:hypothetical protein
MLPFCIASPIAMELLKAYFRWSAAARSSAEPAFVPVTRNQEASP